MAPLRITAAASAIDLGIQKKKHGSVTATLIISNKDMNYVLEIVHILEQFLLILNIKF